jgi:hypothetical protein
MRTVRRVPVAALASWCDLLRRADPGLKPPRQSGPAVVRFMFKPIALSPAAAP